MPKKVLDAEVAGELATLAVHHQLVTLKIDKYKSGKNKGKHYADYTEGERILDVNSINVLQVIHIGMLAGKEYEMNIVLPADQQMIASVTKP